MLRGVCVCVSFEGWVGWFEIGHAFANGYVFKQ